MSSVAMNRRIARETGNSVDIGDNFNNGGQSTNEPMTISGTTTQQHYRILTFHENRLNQVFQQVHVLTAQLNKLEPEMNLRLHRLEQENASLRQQLTNLLSSNTKENTVTLTVDEDDN